MRKTLTDKGVAALKPRPNATPIPTPSCAGTTSASSRRRQDVRRRHPRPDGKQVWATLGATDRMTVARPRESRRGRPSPASAPGMPAFEPKGESFEDVAAQLAEAARRTQRPALARSRSSGCWSFTSSASGRTVTFLSIRRSDVAALLDRCRGRSRRAAGRLRAQHRALDHELARGAHDNYSPPIVRGMRRQSRTRRRAAASLTTTKSARSGRRPRTSGTFGAFVRIALLTAQRRAKVLTMRWADVSDEGEWTIPQEPREKDSAGSLMLPTSRSTSSGRSRGSARTLTSSPARDDGPINGFAMMKRAFDARLSRRRHWTIHDLRRTARSLMSRAGVSSRSRRARHGPRHPRRRGRL